MLTDTVPKWCLKQHSALQTYKAKTTALQYELAQI